MRGNLIVLPIVATGTVSTIGGMAATPWIPPANVEIPLDLGGAISWAVGGALLGLALAGLALWLTIELRERRWTRHLPSDLPER